MKLSRKTTFGSFELFVTLAIVRLENCATGVDIIKEIKKITGRKYSSGAMYSTLHRLADKKLLSSRKIKSRKIRGGRRRTVYKITDKGKLELKSHLESIARLVENTKLDELKIWKAD